MLTIPPYYRPPHGVPLYWRDETTGTLPAAVNAYLDNRICGFAIDSQQFQLVKAFLVYYIGAPCWDHPGADPEYKDKLRDLRIKAASIADVDQTAAFIRDCLDIGLDPL